MMRRARAWPSSLPRLRPPRRPRALHAARPAPLPPPPPWLRVLPAALVAAGGASVFAGASAVAVADAERPPVPSIAPLPGTVPVVSKERSGTLGRYAIADAVDSVLPAVVNIRRVVTRKPGLPRFFGLEEPESVEVSCGSGFLISPEGAILTNAHVVQDVDTMPAEAPESSVLHVTLSTGETYAAKLCAADQISDIAVVKICADYPLPTAKLGDSDSVRVGEVVIGVGAPLMLSNSVSAGVISNVKRDLALATGEPARCGLVYLQTDLAINQGSSGGPCVSLDGEVIGVFSKKIAGGAEGLSFAIPITYARRVVEDLSKHGLVRRPYLGLSLISLTPDVVEDMRHDSNYRAPRWLESEMRSTNGSVPVGLMVHNVVKDGPGYAAGLRTGDVVVSVDQVPTRTTCEFLGAISFKVNTDCKLQVRRADTGKTTVLNIRPDSITRDLESK